MLEGTGVEDQNTDVNALPSDADTQIDAGSGEGDSKKPQFTERELAFKQARDDNAHKLEQERIKNQQLQEQLLNLTKQPEPVEDEDDDYMPLTRADLKKFEAKKQAKVEKEAREKAEKDQQLKVYNSAVKARSKYANSDFPYDEAYKYAMNNFSQSKINAFMMMEDPGQELYDAVTFATGRGREQVVKETLETVNKNMNSANTLSGSGGSNRAIDEIKSYDKLGGRDFIKKMDEIIRSKH